MRTRRSLNGWWDWHIPSGPLERRLVPSSYRCVGEATFETTAEIPCPPGQRAFLCFEGIAFEGEVTVNGQPVGRMLPFVPYAFDITPCLAETANHLQVHIKDLLADYGPVIGWECYAGLLRDVYLEWRSEAYVDDFQWITDLNADFTHASCTLNLWLAGGAHVNGPAVVEIALAHDGQAAAVTSCDVDLVEGITPAACTLELDRPLLWSPEAPNPYDLRLTLRQGATVLDTVERQVGVRSFVVKGTRFCLNGRDIVLKGVCRHDLWGADQGHTLTPAQMEQDMRMLKELGANYVRLVHYPHHPYILDLADRLGLLVSGEPLSWQSDFSDPRITEGALEDLRRLVLRDRNRASVVFWLAWNECQARGDYLARARKVCAELDPTRPVSAANYLGVEETKRVFNAAGLDFYSLHPYAPFPDNIRGETTEAVLRTLSDKPTVFTEWGGFYVQGNPELTMLFGRTFARLTANQVEVPHLAGICFWEWADMPEPVRYPPACKDGILTEGLVDVDRNKKPIHDVMARLLALLDAPPPPPWKPVLEQADLRLEVGAYLPLDLAPLIETNAQAAVWERSLAQALAARIPPMNALVGPLLPEPLGALCGVPTRIAAGRPLLLAEGAPRVEIPVARAVGQVLFWGNVSLVGGYPLGGRHGEDVARYTLVYADGTQQEHVLRNGIELSSAGTITLHSRLDVRAVRAPRAFGLRMDPDWREAYQANVYSVDADPARELRAITFELLNPAYAPLLYGVTVRL
ncbi:MAG: glycoside hydrolase family 2 protein [Anaerolineae bacterium]